MAEPTIDAHPTSNTANCYETLARANSYFADTLREPAWELPFNDDQRKRALIQATQQIEALSLSGGLSGTRRDSTEDSSAPAALFFPREEDPIRKLVNESFTSAHDAAVTLDRKEIQTGTTVVTTSNGVTTYTETDDYTMDDENGTITVLSSGSMADTTGFLIDYSFLAVPEKIESATSEQALWLLQQTKLAQLIDRKALQDQGVKTFSIDGHSESFGVAAADGFGPEVRPFLEGMRRRTGHVGAD